MEEGAVRSRLRPAARRVAPRPDEDGSGWHSQQARSDGGADARSERAREPAIRVVDARVSFPRPHGEPVVALDGLSLDVAAGQVVALIGPNGSGKSTLLRAVGGLIRPDRGRVELGGRPVDGPDPAIGFVFQEPRLLAWRSVLDNVALPLELAGVGRTDREARARELLGVVGLERSAADRPHRLSGGMRQRASIARALALDSGDPPARRALQRARRAHA